MTPLALGGLTPAAFMRTYWQKRPLLIRQALPKYAGIIGRDAFLSLATRDDVASGGWWPRVWSWNWVG